MTRNRSNKKLRKLTELLNAIILHIKYFPLLGVICETVCFDIYCTWELGNGEDKVKWHKSAPDRVKPQDRHYREEKQHENIG